MDQLAELMDCPESVDRDLLLFRGADFLEYEGLDARFFKLESGKGRE